MGSSSFDRRKFLLGGVASTSAAIASSPSNAQQCQPGDSSCDQTAKIARFDPYALQSIDGLDELEEIWGAKPQTTFGMNWLDKRIGLYGFEIERTFGHISFERPAIYYFDDGALPRATYLHARLDVPGRATSDGVIGIGINFVRNLLASANNRDAAIFGILTHELAHSNQYKASYKRILDSYVSSHNALAELHADYMSGWVWGQYPIRNHFALDQNFIQATAEGGDSNFFCSRHHGTPRQRVLALTAGFNARNSGLNIEETISTVRRISEQT